MSGDARTSSRKADGLSNLQLRVISAIVMAAAVLGLTFIGGFAFRLLAAGIAAAILYEWCAMARTPGNVHFQFVPAAFLLAALIAVVAGADAGVALLLTGAGIVATGLAGWFLGHGCSAAVGLAYAALSAISLSFLRGDDFSGLAAILFLFAIVWATDILAYFVGRAIGGPKLAPLISPGKTWSGAIGGAVAGVIAGTIAAAVIGMPAGLWTAGVALLLSVVSQAGDLLESAVKRRHGAKDSGSLIPGHGGVMDRVDGLVAAALALYVVGWMAAGPDNPAHGLFPGGG